MIHTLKIWPEYFEAILDGRKTWEYRKNDRNYQLNDVLRLHEWNNTMQKFTGRMMVVTVTYIYYTPSNTQEFCIMSIVPELESVDDFIDYPVSSIPVDNDRKEKVTRC